MIQEVEAAFLAVDKNAVRAQLKAVGFELETPEYIMYRKVFDFPHSEPGHGKWARVRQEADKVTITVKDVVGTGINDVYETEIATDDFNAAVEFLKNCGLVEKAYQETRREVWRRGAVEAVIDTWPGLNPFVEIEGSDESQVRAVSEELGFDFSKAVFGPAGIIYEKELGIPEAEINKMPEITFANPPQPPAKT